MTCTVLFINNLYIVKYAFKPGHVTYEKQFTMITDAIAFIELLYHNYFITLSMGM